MPLRLVIPALLFFLWAPDAAAQSRSRCMESGQHRAFDFWMGDWEVRQSDGRVAGTNHVERILGGCVLMENWTGAGGSSGKSFNYFDPERREWRQLWVDASGEHMDFHGNVVDGAMRFEGTRVKPDGSTSLMRMTFTPLDDGRVRQYIEESTDGGAAWAQWFDGYYARKEDE